jgi:hypothetical protein
MLADVPDKWRLRRSAAGVGACPAQLCAALVVFFCALSVAGLITPPTVNYDAGLGLHTLASMSRGAAWNHTTSVAAGDISGDNGFFNAAFSPGQYMAPAVFTAFGMKLGTAVLLTCFLATLSGCAGLWRL